ncbi:MAG: pitrilysin family protein [Planctomycetota bacterium]
MLVRLLLLLALDQVSIKLPALHEQRLENGVHLVAVRMAEVPLVHYAAAIDAGSSRDPEGKEGLANLVASLLDQGTLTHPGEQFDTAVDNLGGSFTTATGRDVLSVSATFLAKDQTLGRDLFLEALLEPALAEPDLEKARTRAVADLQAEAEEVADVATDFLYWKLFENSRYAHPPAGAQASLAKITHDDVVGFHRTYFIAPAMLVIAAGDLDPEVTLAALAKRLACLPRTAPHAAPPIPAEPETTPKLRLLLVDNPGTAQAQIRRLAIGAARARRCARARDPRQHDRRRVQLAAGGAPARRSRADLRRRQRGAADARVRSVHGDRLDGLEQLADDGERDDGPGARADQRTAGRRGAEPGEALDAGAARAARRDAARRERGAGRRALPRDARHARRGTGR